MGSVFDDSNQEATELLDSEVEIPVSQEMKIIEIEEEEVEKSELVSAEKEVEIPLLSEEKEREIPLLSEEKEVEIPLFSDEKEVAIQVNLASDEAETLSPVKKYRVVFVLGGPGGGKSTQCANISKEIGFTHLSSGDLLRKASQIDPENGLMIQSMIKEGESVPPELTMVILMKAIENSGNDKFILDGFPRDEEIRAAFEDATKTEPELVLFFDCSEDEREKRILSRNQDRVDDNPESIRKRFKYFEEHTLPVVEYYNSKGKVYKIDASKTKEEVFDTIKRLLSKTVVDATDEAEAGEADLDISELKLLSI